MQIILFDTALAQQKLYPFSLTRPLSTVRHGLFTLIEWYSLVSEKQVYPLSSPYFSGMEGLAAAEGPFLCIDATVIPTLALWQQMQMLQPGHALEDGMGLIAWMTGQLPEYNRLPLFFGETHTSSPAARISHPMDWVKTNAAKIAADSGLVSHRQTALADGAYCRVYGSFPVYMDEGARASGAIFNTEEGPVLMGRNALVMEGACIKGPVAIGEGAVVKMGAQVYAGTTIGRFAVAGGEIKNSILGDFSNKAHHGYMGDSIAGNWCNLGAGTSNSNVKNNAGEIAMWDNLEKGLKMVGRKAGFVMGDYSKTAINTSINTGTTIGVCCSLHQPGFTGKHIPSMSWGPGQPYETGKALAHLANWFQLKNQPADPALAAILARISQSQQPS